MMNYQENLPRKLLSFQIGYCIAGRNEIYRIIKGGMGIVYVCYDHQDKEVYGRKIFQDKYPKDKNRRDMFKKEAFAWIHLGRHLYIVRSYFVDELYYRLFVMAEFIALDEQNRNTITHYLLSNITLKQALACGLQFCHGMEYAYSKGVTPHRAIKPDNIMIT
jgi:eukaryotic-like serine/threonine-protein kinase